MLDFKNQSFEKVEFKTWKTWKVYDISYDWLYWVSNETLDAIIKKDIDISDEYFKLISNEIKEVYYEDYKKEFTEEEVNWLSINSLKDLLSNEVYKLDFSDNITRDQLREELNKKLLKIYSNIDFKFFKIKDPRKTKLTNERSDLYSENNFPKSIINLLTHWTYYIPQNIRWKVKSEIKQIIKWSDELSKEKINFELEKKNLEFLRILKHFSDFWTRYVVNNSFIPRNQVINATNGRSITDPARKLWTPVMNKDFYNNELPKALLEGTEIGALKQESYHLNIKKKAYEVISKEWWVIFIDNHDTGVVDMWNSVELDRYDDWGFPLITLWTKDWESCNQEIVEYYSERIKFHLWIDVLINKPYKWWYVTQKHWVERREELRKQWKSPGIMNVIQQEVWKFLYLDERTQIVDKDKTELIWVWLARAQLDLWRKFWKAYYKVVKKWEAAVKNYLANYKEF